MSITRLPRAAAALVLATALAGCYENLEPEPASSSSSAPPPAGQSPAATDPTNQPRPGLSASKRAAENTADQINERQRQLDEMMDEDQ